MRGTWISRLRAGAKALLSDQRGNAFMLTAAAIIPVIGIVGSAVDIGRAYMTQLRLQQACDSGVLAGRRAMGGATYSDAAQAEANKMFNFNFPEAKYGASGILFSSQAINASDVAGQASAALPTELMFLFGKDQFRLSANCTAKLEISNVDVMLVLDVTGSMAQTNSGDTVNRITALQDATMDFFDTLTTADIGDGRLRFGVVPYSSTANVGAILREENPDWLSDFTILPSRSPVIRYDWSGTNPPTSVTTGTTTNGAWENFLPISGFTNSTACSAVVAPADTMPALTDAQNMNRTARVVDRNGTRRYVTVAGTQHRYFNYRYNYNSSDDTCWLQRRTVTFDHTASPAPSSTSFFSQYRYEDRLFDVSSAKNGGTISVDTGDSGALQSVSWSGCVIERRTSPFGASSSASDSALDMDIDLVPNDENSRWRILLPEISYHRATNLGTVPSGTGVRTIASSNVSGGNWQNYSYHASSGWGACPVEAMKLTEMDKDDRPAFNTYIQSLQPLGGTYHDAGMIWGARLLSPSGLFADENATAPNNRPISRHIVFMTDGAMAPNWQNLTFQGYEYLMQRISGSATTDNSLLTARHNNRFVQLCRAARQRGITIWVVSFGVGSNSNLNSCASSGEAFEADNAAELNEQFQAIARQISKLRLSQ
ncbi:pilus assembly protein [Sphingopyxis sp. SE2]|jgi:Flp pilus assembly protein TadG|uniref:TadE/TadG family type IV pilus assembly protein n=1 Tax=unclassified Sphingopyxis TaxID=2614943 RepID=UPI00050EFC30|nr:MULTISPECIES: TadE/TadG family type IV pilus assembly protein [unclassified Sphingopyxis]KGB57978.1 Flp pilus assembly protein TadG precursor [Sphingopyxis sp. LC363]MDT7529614.1 pilus assembly protein [Sphingopyxis sp. SE2]